MTYAVANADGKQTTIRTNNVPRDILNAWELTPAERAEFDYLDWDAIEAGSTSASFFRFKGQLYDLGEFSRVIAPDARRCHPMECAAPEFQGWDGYQSDSFFSGLLVKYPRDGRDIDCERVIVGVYCC